MREEPQPGDAFAGHVIEAEIGRGGMGIVFRARNVALDRLRAIKVVAPELSADPAFAARFRREARLAASVEHPNVVTVHHAGDEGGLLYIVMRYVDGVDLARLVADGPLPIERAMAILRPVAAALDAAHASGLVHRDVKPANVLIEDAPGGERVYLTDFGISKPLDAPRPAGSTATTALTMSGQVLGTADYVSPEAIEGDDVDARSDVYSLACLAYHLLCGRPPFPRERELATLIAHTKAERPSAVEANPELRSGVDAVLRAGMAIDPAARPPSAGEFVERLDEALGTAGALRRRRSRAPLIAALAIVALAAAAVAFALTSGGDDEDAPAVPLVETGEVGAGPVGVAVGDQRIWVASRDAGELGRLCRDSPVAAKPPIPLPEPRAVAVGLGSVWVVNGEWLYKVNPDEGKPTEIEVGAGPTDVDVDNEHVWVANEDDDTVTRIDPFGAEPTETIQVGSEPHEIDSEDGNVWVSTPGDGTIERINAKDAEVTRTVDVGTKPTSLAIGSSAVWVADNQEGLLRRVDLETTKVVGSPIEVAPKPRAVAVGFASVWVASGGSGVVEQFDPETETRIGEPIEVGEGPSSDPADLAIGDAAIYSANFGDATVTRIEPQG